MTQLVLHGSMFKSNIMLKDFESYVISSILANNEFGINEVKEMKEIRTMIFQRQQYPEIVELINRDAFDVIQNLAESSMRTSEYLSIMKFSDQNRKEYTVTVYDRDDLSQDPQVIDIFWVINESHSTEWLCCFNEAPQLRERAMLTVFYSLRAKKGQPITLIPATSFLKEVLCM